MEYIAFDCYKRYTYVVVEDEEGWVKWEGKKIVHWGKGPASDRGTSPKNLMPFGVKRSVHS
jgi:hypothetical protein